MKSEDKSKRSAGFYALLAVKGMCMGAIDLVPGVSGGTVAFVTGIYEELIDSIKSINLSLIAFLFRGKFYTFWKQLNGSFLLTVICGIMTSIFCLAGIITYLKDTFPIPVWSFFTGLVAASAVYVLKGLKTWNVWGVLILLAGIVSAFVVCRLSPTQTPNDYWFIFLSGAIAICVMILPAVSGAFVLLLLGKYFFVLDAVSSFQWDVLLVFATGAFVGIVAFSHLLSWLLKHYYYMMCCLLAGFMFGSIEKIWPWKEADVPPHTGVAILFLFLGFAMVFGIEFLAKQIKKAK